MQKLGLVVKIWPSEANFLLIEFINHKGVYTFLKSNGIIVRDRSNEPNCNDCLRVTVGTPNENYNLINILKQFENLTINNYEKNTIS